MDLVYRYLKEAEGYENSIVDISLADMLFEDTNESKEAIENNDSSFNKATTAVSNAIKEIIKKVTELIDRLKDFFKERFMSAEDRRQYAEFKRKLKQDPELANTKVTIVDFREYQKAYDEALKELEALANKEDASKEDGEKVVSELDSKIETLTDIAKAKALDTGSKISGIAKRAVMSTTLSTAVEVADNNALCAKTLNTLLQTEIVSLKGVENELGKHQANKFKRKINRMSNRGWIYALRCKIFKKEQLTLEAIMNSQKKKIFSFFKTDDKGKIKGVTPVTVMTGMKTNPKLTVDALGGPVEATKAVGKVAVLTADAAKVGVKAAKTKKEVDDFKNFVKFSKPKKEKPTSSES